MKRGFRAEEFLAALDRARAARGLMWKQVAEQSGVGASTLARMAHGKRPDVDNLAALLQWSGLSADLFLAPGAGVAPRDPLAQITNMLYADDSLSEDSRGTMIDMITAVYARSRPSILQKE